MDSTGISVLLNALRHFTAAPTIVLVCPTARVLRPFEVTGLVGHLTIFDRATRRSAGSPESAAGARILVAELLEALGRAVRGRRGVVLGLSVGRGVVGGGPSAGSVSVAGSTVVVVGVVVCLRRRGRLGRLGSVRSGSSRRASSPARRRRRSRRAARPRAAAPASRARAVSARRPEAGGRSAGSRSGRSGRAARASIRTGAGSRPRREGRSARGRAAARLPRPGTPRRSRGPRSVTPGSTSRTISRSERARRRYFWRAGIGAEE